MDFYILRYFLVDDYLERRSNYRDAHLKLANELHSSGKLILGGAMNDPADVALLVFKVNDKSVIEDFVSNDPYVINSLVVKWEIRKWNVVIGK